MHLQPCNYLIHKESVYCLTMTTTSRVNDENKDRLCIACEIEPLNHNSDSWCPRCKCMIHPHCSGRIPLHESSKEDKEIVNQILQNHSRRSTIGRIREWHKRLDTEDSEWLFVSQESHLQSIVDDQKANEIRTRIFDQNGASGRRRDGPGLRHARRAGIRRALCDRGRRRRHAPRVRRASGERGAGSRSLVAAALGRLWCGNGPVGPERRLRARRWARVLEGPHIGDGPRGGKQCCPGQFVALARRPRGAGARRAAAFEASA